MNAALEAVHHGSNNVHADAAARNFRDFSGGAEAGLEHQVERVLVAHAFGFFRLDNSFFDRVGANQREIYSAAVITDFDHHLSALMIGVQINGAARGLCGSEALFGRAYAVIHGVSNQVHQRLGEGIQKDRKSTRLNSSHGYISYAVFCLKKKKTKQIEQKVNHYTRHNVPSLAMVTHYSLFTGLCCGLGLSVPLLLRRTRMRALTSR